MRSEIRARVALVTGASSGIGEAAARALARHGWNVILAARRQERLAVIARDLRSQTGVRAFPVTMDVTQVSEIERGIADGLAEFGHIDVVINSAGLGCMDWLERLDPAEGINRQIQVNLLGPILVSRAILPHMQAARGGHLIFVASLASFVGTPTYSVYAASKFGLRGFCQALRREVSVWGIQVSSFYPGAVGTGFAAEAVARRKTRLTTPRPMVMTVEAAGDRLAWLASHPRRTVVMPAIAWAAIAANALLPGLVDLLADRLFVARERLDDTAGTPPGAASNP
jgi:short-subunit dehydrogenase